MKRFVSFDWFLGVVIRRENRDLGQDGNLSYLIFYNSHGSDGTQNVRSETIHVKQYLNYFRSNVSHLTSHVSL